MVFVVEWTKITRYQKLNTVKTCDQIKIRSNGGIESGLSVFSLPQMKVINGIYYLFSLMKLLSCAICLETKKVMWR